MHSTFITYFNNVENNTLIQIKYNEIATALLQQ